MKIILLLILFSCQDKHSDYIKSYQIAKVPNSLSNSDVDEKLSFKWLAPSNWITKTKSSMRAASYSVSSSKGEGDVSVMYLNGDGGGIAANVNRWREQLSLPILSELEIESNAEVLISQIGKYYVYEIVNVNNKEASFLCSIIPADNFTIFIKLNAHAEALDELKQEFIYFSSSFEYNE
tara:strand:- start:187 stop:723 length:537 start_codon:yes stop_codon:yes gene_type:complete